MKRISELAHELARVWSASCRPATHETAPDAYARGVDRGIEHERARIVAALREYPRDLLLTGTIADVIESGELQALASGVAARQHDDASNVAPDRFVAAALPIVMKRYPDTDADNPDAYAWICDIARAIEEHEARAITAQIDKHATDTRVPTDGE